MEGFVQYITSYREMNLNVFLVVDNGETYILCYESSHNRYGYMCPCCMLEKHRSAITEKIKEGIAKGRISKNIIWCSHRSHSPQHADSANKFFSKLGEVGVIFKGGSAENISLETKRLIMEEAFLEGV